MIRAAARAWIIAALAVAAAPAHAEEAAPAEEAEAPSAWYAPWPAARLLVDLAIYSHGRWASRPGTDLTEVRLDRGELGARVALGPRAGAELRLEAIRSALEGGALGIDGDSTVLRVRLAQVMATATLGPVRLDGALGVVPDPWIRRVEEDYTLRPLSRSGSERLLGWAPADLAAFGRAALGPARLTVTFGNGEGLRFPERNTGKTTTAVLEVVAVAAPSLRLSFAAVARDGSIGVASVRDRRAGVGATLVAPRVRAGVEAVQAWGLGDRGDLEALEAAGWAEATIAPRVFASARAATLGLAGGAGRASTFGAAVALEPWSSPVTASRGAPGRARLWLAVDRITSSGDAMPVVGADAGAATVVMLIASADAPFNLD